MRGPESLCLWAVVAILAAVFAAPLRAEPLTSLAVEVRIADVSMVGTDNDVALVLLVQ